MPIIINTVGDSLIMKKFFNKLYKGGKADFFSAVKAKLSADEKMFIVTANPEAFMFGAKDSVVESLLLDDNTTLLPTE